MTDAEQHYSLPRRWWVFIQERFALGEHLLMVFFLTLGNSTVACWLMGVAWQWSTFLVSVLVSLLFFFRLRCFDEIKDYQVDLKVNPTRPLARGLLAVSQVKVMFLSLTVIELAIVSLLGWPVALTHLLAVVYSYLMYKEFFIGKWLSPHLTTYAVTHTFVSILVGYSIFAQNSGVGVQDFSAAVLCFGVVNWALFNLFEFARKTYAPQEERPRVDTYSSLFQPLGAGLLSLSQVALALVVLVVASRQHDSIVLLGAGPASVAQIVAALAVLVATLRYVSDPTPRHAHLFRTVCSLYLVVFFVILSAQGLYPVFA